MTKNGPFNSIHFLFKSYSNPIYFLFKSYSNPIHFLFISYSASFNPIQFYGLSKSRAFNSIPRISFPIHFLLKSYSFPIHFLFCLILSYKLVLFEILVEVSLLSPWRSPCRRGTRVIISTPLIPVHVTFAHRVTTCTGSTDKERRLSRSTRNP